jgi:uncharacterized protein YbjT (DUF2867 family)
LPQIRLPWDNNAAAAAVQKNKSSSYSSLRPNDTILIFGGTGGVGQLVARKLLCRRSSSSSSDDGYTVRVAARNPSRAYELLRSSATTVEDENTDTTTSNIKNNADSKLEVVQVDLVGKPAITDDELRSIMIGVSAIVITVGTTAFPTSRWFSSDKKYEIVNTPTAIDNVAVSRIGQIASTISTIRHIVLVTSIGTSRTNSIPFTFLNLFGVLDSKRAGEDAIITSAITSNSQSQLSYTIIRPGRLVGGPYTNLDIANLLQISGGISNRVTLVRGDTLVGDCKRTSVAEAVVRCLELRDDCANIDFSIIDNNDEENTLPLTDDEWRESFASMK